MTLPFVAVVFFLLFFLGFAGAPAEFGLIALFVIGVAVIYTLGSGIVGGVLGTLPAGGSKSVSRGSHLLPDAPIRADADRTAYSPPVATSARTWTRSTPSTRSSRPPARRVADAAVSLPELVAADAPAVERARERVERALMDGRSRPRVAPSPPSRPTTRRPSCSRIRSHGSSSRCLTPTPRSRSTPPPRPQPRSTGSARTSRPTTSCGRCRRRPSR